MKEEEEEEEGIGVKTSRVSRFGYHSPQDCRVNSALSILLDFSFPFASSTAGFNSRLVFLRARGLVSARARANCDA